MPRPAGAARRRARRTARSPVETRLDLVFRALGDTTRRRILARLTRGPETVTELAAPFAMSLPAISRHLKVLENARLIVRHVDGRVHHCILRAEPLGAVEAWLDQYREFWDGTLDALASYAEQHAGAPLKR
jgi:DNA-binding transcriptional ArsR family regulator